jgi:dipeptidyl aminopeptidase/acylaminoacyl peptidase
VDANRDRIAWAEVQSDGTNVISLLYTATTAGADRNLALRFSSTRRLAALPVHLTADGRTLYYTRQPLPEPGAYALFDLAADLYALDVRTGESTHLPDEPLCECAVGFTADGRQYARVQPEDDGNGFLVRLRDQGVDRVTILNAVEDLLHTQAGYVTLSPDGGTVLYASARGTGSLRSERWTLTLADRNAGTQTLLTGALTDGIRPLAFAPDGKSVILIGITKAGTWKVTLADRQLQQISAYNYLGNLSSN